MKIRFTVFLALPNVGVTEPHFFFARGNWLYCQVAREGNGLGTAAVAMYSKYQTPAPPHF